MIKPFYRFIVFYAALGRLTSGELFFCDSFEIAQQLLDMKVDRFLMNKDTVYLYTQHLLITFSIPILISHNSSDQFYLNAPFNAEPLTMNASNEAKTNESIGRSMGYLYFETNQTTYEIMNTNGTISFFRLNFLEEVYKGKRVEKVMNENFVGANYMTIPLILSNHAIIWSGSRGETFDLRHSNTSFQMMTLNEKGEIVKNEKIATNKSSEKAVFYKFENDQILHNNSTLIEIKDQLYFDVSQYTLSNDEASPDLRLVEHSFELQEFFFCFRPIREVEDVKGIFYQNETLFIIVNRYYLTIVDDLIANKFNIIDRHYETKQNLDLNLGDKIRFKDFGVKYIKNLGERSYFMLFEAIYELNIVNRTKFQLILNKNLTFISKCNKQTLRIANYIYCFDEKHYWTIGRLDGTQKSNRILNSEHHSIVSMFKDLKYLKYGSNEQCLFIFNYNSTERVVFVTKKHFYLIAYAQLTIDSNRSYRLVVDANFEIKKYTNCLFESCDLDSFTSIKTTEIVPERIVPFVLKYIVILLFGIIFTLIVLIASYVMRSNSNQSPPSNLFIKHSKDSQLSDDQSGITGNSSSAAKSDSTRSDIETEKEENSSDLSNTEKSEKD